jgi:trimethylamine--corrinoid protein Co-methyltransferase
MGSSGSETGRRSPRRRRGGGRSTRRQAREAGQGRHTVVGPGLKGGAFKPLSEQDILHIHRTALNVLENVGIADPLPEMLDLALAQGCWLNEHNRLCFPRAFVEDVIAGACREFTIYGRDPAFNIKLGGTNVHFSTAGQAVTVYKTCTIWPAWSTNWIIFTAFANR